MDTNHIEYLFQRYLEGNCTEQERTSFLQLIEAGEQDELLRQLLETKLQVYAPDKSLDQLTADAMFSHIIQNASTSSVPKISVFRKIRHWKYYAAAAVAVLVIGASFWLREKESPVSTDGRQQVAVVAETAQPVAGGNKAILVLADGSRVVLDTTEDGTIAIEGNTTITKNSDGELSYQLQKGATATGVQYNTLSTPLGGQYKIKLPDGSKVWLNAASSIRYPTAFTGKKREVTITGEAFFEVTKNASMPFVVSTPNMDVQVLGTQFNVNSYDDEPASRTTLSEGSVRVSSVHNRDISELLKPGEQAQLLTTTTPAMQVRNVDVEAVTAWKNGYFHFDGTPAQEVMRQISRWYDADITCDSKLTRHFRGMISRTASMEEVFHMLSITGEFKYKINGRKVTVTP